MMRARLQGNRRVSFVSSPSHFIRARIGQIAGLGRKYRSVRLRKILEITKCQSHGVMADISGIYVRERTDSIRNQAYKFTVARHSNYSS
jgi:hypothetical protein